VEQKYNPNPDPSRLGCDARVIICATRRVKSHTEWWTGAARGRAPLTAALTGESGGRCRPDWSKAHFRCGEALMDLNRASEAVKHFQTAAKLEPSVFVQKRLSEVRFGLGCPAHVWWDTGPLRHCFGLNERREEEQHARDYTFATPTSSQTPTAAENLGTCGVTWVRHADTGMGFARRAPRRRRAKHRRGRRRTK